MLQGGEEVFGKEHLSIGAERVAVAVKNAESDRVVNGGAVADSEGKRGATQTAPLHLGFDERADVVERDRAAVGVVTLRQNGEQPGGGGQRHVNEGAVNGYAYLADLRG